MAAVASAALLVAVIVGTGAACTLAVCLKRATCYGLKELRVRCRRWRITRIKHEQVSEHWVKTEGWK